MGVLEDCADFVTAMGPGKALFRHGPASDEIAERLVDLIGGLVVPSGTTTLFASDKDVERPPVRAYVRGEVDNGLHVTVAVFDAGQFTAVDDQATLERVRDRLGVDVNQPNGGAAYLRPSSTDAQRSAIAELRAGAERPSRQKLVDYLDKLSAGLTDEPGWLADRSGLLGVPLSLFGTEPGYDLGALDSAAPVTAGRVAEALGGTFARVELSQVVDELTSGRARSALVQGRLPGAADPEMRWLVRDDDGALRWAVNAADGMLPEFTVDGARDSRTRLLEQRDTTTLFLGPDGIAYAPDPPVPVVGADHGFHLSVNTRVSGQAILVGEWNRGLLTETQRSMREEADRTDVPSVLVNVRNGRPVNGLGTLEESQSNELNSILGNNPEIPLVLATAENPHLMWLTTQGHQRSAVQPVPVGFGTAYDVMGPSGQRDRYGRYAPEMLARGRSLARTEPDFAMPELRSLVASRTWNEAAQRFAEHAGIVGTDVAAEQIARMIRQHDQRMLATDHLLGGVVGDSPFAEPEVALPAYQVLVNTALRTAGRTGSSIQPTNAWITEPIERHSGPVDEKFLLGYLTDRPVPLEEQVGASTLGLLWLREMVQAMLGEATGLAPADGIAVMKAKGELPGERAARPPRQPETLRAHAVIAENVFSIVRPDSGLGIGTDLQKLLDSIDCLTGEDRVAWIYMDKNQVRPDFPEFGEPLTGLVDTIASCH